MHRIGLLACTVALSSLAACAAHHTDHTANDQGAATTSAQEPGVIGIIDQDHVDSMTADETTLYFGSDGHISSLPKTGGVRKALFDEPGETQSRTTGIAVDAEYVYFTGTGSNIVSRVAKAGGPRQILANVGMPGQLVLDDANVYIALDFGTGNGGIIRLPKAGDQINTPIFSGLATTALELRGDTIYFVVTNADRTKGAIESVSKNGGSITELTKVDGPPNQIIVTSNAIFFVDAKGTLMRIPLTGGTPTLAGAGPVDGAIAGDDGDIFAPHLAVGSNAATLERVDTDGNDLGKVTEWSFRHAKPAELYPGTGQVLSSQATLVDATHVYWLAYETNDLDYMRTTVRTAVR